MSRAHLVAVALAALPLLAAPAKAEPDALVRPATMLPHAANAVMLAVTRAGDRLVAAGERGIVLLSDDNGVRWRQARTPVSISLTNVVFPTDKVGWAIGHSGVVLKTEDGGETWVRQIDGNRVAEIALQAAKAGGAPAQALADAERLAADGPDKPFFDAWFSSATEGFIVGAYGLVLGTRDGGASWEWRGAALDNPKGKHLYGIARLGERFLVAGEQGAVFLSADGGKSFRTLGTPYGGTYFGAVWSDAEGLVVFGLRGNAFCSLDGGVTWTKVDTRAPATLTAGRRLADGSIALVDESGRLLRGGCKRGFEIVKLLNPYPYAALAQAADGTLVLAGVRGLRRHVATTASAGQK